MKQPTEILHILPLGDTEEHSETINKFGGIPMDCLCKCAPRIEIEGDTFIFVHNSFDGREGVEWTNQILNDNNPFEGNNQ